MKKPPDKNEEEDLIEIDASLKKKGRKPTVNKKPPDKLSQNINEWAKKPPDKLVTSFARMMYTRTILSGRINSFRGRLNTRFNGCSELLGALRLFRMKELLKVFITVWLKLMLNFRRELVENELRKFENLPIDILENEMSVEPFEN
ncbi:MAG: hypothetical protein Ta2E_10880 [Mycoplasmoidaceae bacterium]|nr:MAG: hypothetical protein Ta2E_10880 [Mycoplasmoidaceae bacterium]